MRFVWAGAVWPRLGAFVVTGLLVAGLAIGANSLVGQAAAEAEEEDASPLRGPRFEFHNFCGVGVAGDVLTLTGGGLNVSVNIAHAHGNLQRGGHHDGPGTGGTSPTLAERVADHLVSVHGVVVGGQYVARVVNVGHQLCDDDGTPGNPQLTRTPRPTRTPHPTRTPRPTRTTTP